NEAIWRRTPHSPLQAERRPPTQQQENSQGTERNARDDDANTQPRREAQPPKNDEELAGRTPREREPRDQPPNDSAAPPRQSPPAPSQNSVVALALMPGLARGSADLPKLTIPAGTRRARLRVGLERSDEGYESYRVEIRDASGQAVWHQRNLRQRARGVVTLDLSADTLNAGEYELTLRGVTPDGVVEDIGYYYFNVLKR
ncbi:MAG: hypothetical protein ACRD68_15195, partial [Pyrinomonadaceae bacterium]